MPEGKNQAGIHPPRMIPSFAEGFQSIANRIYIIIFPVLLDLLLWFGPLVRIREVVLPFLNRAAELSAGAYGEEGAALIAESTAAWEAILERFNLLSLLRTFPVGIPSLLAGRGVDANPLGLAVIRDISSSNGTVNISLGILVVGILLGCIYFSLTASASLQTSEPVKTGNFFRQFVQIMILNIMLVGGLAILLVPLLCLMAFLLFMLPSLGTIPVILFGLALVWVLFPLAFSPHGIIANQQNASRSAITSMRIIRSLAGPAGIFFILAILLSKGLNALWLTPQTNSWMLLVGIFGHGFISSGILAASFIYYRDGYEWITSQLAEKENTAQPTISQ